MPLRRLLLGRRLKTLLQGGHRWGVGFCWIAVAQGPKVCEYQCGRVNSRLTGNGAFAATSAGDGRMIGDAVAMVEEEEEEEGEVVVVVVVEVAVAVVVYDKLQVSFEPQTVDPSGLERRAKQVAAHYSRQGPSIYVFRGPTNTAQRPLPTQTSETNGRAQGVLWRHRGHSAPTCRATVSPVRFCILWS